MFYQETQSNSALRKFALIFNRFVFCACCFSWLSGCLSVAFGIYELFYAKHRIIRLVDLPGLFTGAMILTNCGFVLIIINSIGCVGTVKRSKTLVSLFAVLTSFLCIVYLGCGLWASSYYGQVSVDLEKLFSKLVEEYDERRLLVEENTKYLNYVQYKLVCCGKNSVEDFQKQKPMLSCGSEPRERQGCLPVTRSAMQAGLFRMAAFGFSEALLQVFVTIVAYMDICWM